MVEPWHACQSNRSWLVHVMGHLDCKLCLELNVFVSHLMAMHFQKLTTLFPRMLVLTIINRSNMAEIGKNLPRLDGIVGARVSTGRSRVLDLDRS
jgi:hypothetical protein